MADVLGMADLAAQVRWLARVLAARRFPLERLARDLEIAAQVVGEGAFREASSAVAERLLGAVEAVDGLEVGGGVAGGREKSEGTPG
ncbi:MAG: hypothetical protein ACR2KV_08840 [Solirubrobacteraceae bacterium]